MRRLVSFAVVAALAWFIPSTADARGKAALHLSGGFSQDFASEEKGDDSDGRIGVNVAVGLGDGPWMLDAGWDVGFSESWLCVDECKVIEPGDNGHRFQYYDVFAGLRYEFRRSARVVPHLAAGAEWVSLLYRDRTAPHDFPNEKDESLGYYVGGGVSFNLLPHFVFGIRAKKLLGTDVELRNADSADHMEAGVFVGGSWGYPRHRNN